jgi:predicted DNA-binding mobile mystery protein A
MLKQLIRDQYREISQQLIDIKEINRPKEGWIRTVRKALSMSGPQLAKRIGLSNSQVSQMERLEIQDRITLKQLRKVADQLDCDLMYGFVPRKEIKQIIKERALTKARDLVYKTDVQMKLEKQQLSTEQLNENILREAEKITYELPRDLWED